jgi:hypothetical protein
MRPLLWLSFAICLGTPAFSATPLVSPRAVFAHHDPYGRLANTRIRELGALRVRSASYKIYYLGFVNPVSRHGQQRIAVVKNHKQFAGTYQCTLGPEGAEIDIGTDRIMVSVSSTNFVIQFDKNGPSRNKHFCGEGSGWEPTI